MTTETNLKITRESSNLLDQVIYENLEPATPILYQHISDDEKHENIEFNTPRVESNVRANEKYEIANLASPWGSLHMRSAGMKVRVSLLKILLLVLHFVLVLFFYSANMNIVYFYRIHLSMNA